MILNSRMEAGISKRREEQRHKEEKRRVRPIKDLEGLNRLCWKTEEEVEVFLWKLEHREEVLRDTGSESNKRDR